MCSQWGKQWPVLPLGALSPPCACKRSYMRVSKFGNLPRAFCLCCAGGTRTGSWELPLRGSPLEAQLAQGTSGRMWARTGCARGGTFVSAPQ